MRGQAVRVERPVDQMNHRVLVLGWNRRVPSLIAEFLSYGHRHFEVDLVSVVPKAEREQAIARYVDNSGRLTCRHIEADYMVEGSSAG